MLSMIRTALNGNIVLDEKVVIEYSACLRRNSASAHSHACAFALLTLIHRNDKYLCTLIMMRCHATIRGDSGP